MDLGSYAAPSSSLVSAVEMTAVLLGHGLCVHFQSVALRLRGRQPAVWWLSAARDGINLGSLMVLVLALIVRGLPAPAAILLGGSSAAVLLLTRSATWRMHGGLATTLLVAAGLAVPPLLAPERTLAILNGLAAVF